MHRLVCILLLNLLLTAAVAQINIWEGTSVHENVVLTPYLSDTLPQSPQIAIIVCPGGSYFWHDTNTEGPQVGQWLQQNGISAFILNYRTAHVPAFLFHYRLLFRGNRYPDAQDDLRQAIQYVKAHAEEYHIDSTKIGVMGFSAGGHLVMSAAELFNQEDRPAFVASIYPVVTMQEPYVHKRSRRGLLGDSRTRNQALCDKLSLERHVPADCPPVFLMNCLDDPIVDYHNAVLLDSALTAKQIDHRYIQFQTGGHGFGASEQEGTPECRQWKLMFLKWIKKIL
jgi:acetyl esterase/lipase